MTFTDSMGSLFKSDRKAPDVREGSVFRHTGPGNRVETAEVVHVGPDFVGIPHVRYKVMVEKCRIRYTEIEARRILNLNSFTTYFSESVEP